MEGVKRKRRCQIQCKDHILNIKTLKGNASRYDFNQSFCPKFQREPLPPEHTFPEFNNDGKFYTSAFILGVDRRILVKFQQQEIMDHQKQIRDSLQKHNQLVFPRPNSKHSLCSVCKEQYRNYYYHISSEDHRDKIGLSQYNYYIKQLCSRYIELWEGAEQRADEEAQRRLEEEQLRRQQQAQITIQEGEQQQQQQSLLDVQRGENMDPNQQKQEDDDEALYTEKSRDYRSKKYRPRYAYNQDTVPLQRPCKRIAPEGRTYQSEYMKKKLFLNSGINLNRIQRQKRQNRYERQRDRLKSDREHPENKQFAKTNEKEGDVFVVMKLFSTAIASTQPTLTLPPQQPQLQPQPQPQPQQHQNITVQRQEFVWKRTTDKLKKQIEKLKEKEAKQQKATEKYQKLNKKYQIEYNNEEKSERPDEREYQKSQSKYPYQYYNYPQMPSYMPPNTSEYKQLKHPNQVSQHYKNIPDPYKNAPPNPYYYNPYMHPMYQSQYPRNQKSYDYPPYNEKDKSKSGEKLYSEKPQGQKYDYNMSYQWPYHNPYYLPPQMAAQPTGPHPDRPPTVTSKSTVSTNPYGGNTSININFPMYMCPPPHPSIQGIPPPYSMPPSRYPGQINPNYMSYQYPYLTGRQGEYPGGSEQHNKSNKSLPSQSYPLHQGQRENFSQRNLQVEQGMPTHSHNSIPQYPHHMPMPVPGQPQMQSHPMSQIPHQSSNSHSNHPYPVYGNYNHQYPPHYHNPQSTGHQPRP